MIEIYPQKTKNNNLLYLQRYALIFIILLSSCLIFFGGFLETKVLYAKERILSLKPNITEILYKLELQDQIVAVTSYCDYPKKALSKPKVADYLRINAEKALLLNPSLILISKENTQQRDLELFKKRNVEIMVLDFDSIKAIQESILKIGKRLAKTEDSLSLVQEMKLAFKTLRKLNHQKNKKVVIVVGQRPLVVAGGKNYFNDLLAILGYDNISKASELKYPHYPMEKLIEKKPDIIFDLSSSHESNKADSWSRYQSIPAVKNGKIIRLNISEFRPSYRLMESAQKLMSP